VCVRVGDVACCRVFGQSSSFAIQDSWCPAWIQRGQDPNARETCPGRLTWH